MHNAVIFKLGTINFKSVLTNLCNLGTHRSMSNQKGFKGVVGRRHC